MRTEFFLPMVPPTATHQEKKWRVVHGKPVSYEPPEVKAARSKLTAYLAGHRPERPMEGAVRLVVKWCFPCGAGNHRDGEYRTSRPDTDNLQKLLKDCMTHVGFWRDDAQVACEVCEKFWAGVPGLYICAEEIELEGKHDGPLTLDELREMDGEPVWIVEEPDWGHWELSYDAEDYLADRDTEFYGMGYDDPAGRYGLHKLGWLAYRRKPERSEENDQTLL